MTFLSFKVILPSRQYTSDYSSNYVRTVSQNLCEKAFFNIALNFVITLSWLSEIFCKSSSLSSLGKKKKSAETKLGECK